MIVHGKLVQANVFQIGASVGVVLEMTTADIKEAVDLRESLLIVLDAFMKAKKQRPISHEWEEEDGIDVFKEVLENALNAYLHSE